MMPIKIQLKLIGSSVELNFPKNLGFLQKYWLKFLVFYSTSQKMLFFLKTTWIIINIRADTDSFLLEYWR